MTNNLDEGTIMKSMVTYCVGGGNPGKAGEAYLTKDSLSIKKFSQVIKNVFIYGGAALGFIIVTRVIGIGSSGYIEAALFGSLSGMAGAALGIFAFKAIPKKAGETDIIISRSDIVSITDKRMGVRTAIEVHTSKGIACVMAGLTQPEEWKRVLKN